MNNWRKDIAQWTIKDTLYLSVVFTWDLPKARKLAEASKKKVVAGGPAVSLMPDYLADVAQIGGELPYSPLAFHNPMATFTTRGCVNKCAFCIVPKIEGDFVELENFIPRPIVCDNNFLASSKKHFDRVIDSLKSMPFVDFNQGLEARLFTSYHADRFAELRSMKVRFSFDSWGEQNEVADAVKLARSKGLKDFGINVLINFKDTPQEAVEKLEWVRSLKIWPNPMRFQPLTALRKNEYISPKWSAKQLQDITRYYFKLRYLEHIPFDEYRNGNYDYVNQGVLPI